MLWSIAKDGSVILHGYGPCTDGAPNNKWSAENCRYYLQGRELFARSYAQYLADKSKNRVLLHQVRQRRESVEGRFYQVQWAEGDFRAVAQAFDRSLEEYRWLR